MASFMNLIEELRIHDLDSIRFASYRTACKLKYLQQRLYFHQVDIWNIIESVRENALNNLQPETGIDVPRISALVTSIYQQLNKRLPITHQVDIPGVAGALTAWISLAFDCDLTREVPILSLKVFLALLSSGKVADKYRYIFSLIADSSGWLLQDRLSQFLHASLRIPHTVLESPSFSFTEDLPSALFNPQQKYTINSFLQVMLADPGPQCFLWLPLLSKLASVEAVLHPVSCDACRRESFYGFRYKCQRCYNYQMCQDCFWRGRTSNQHSTQHPIKEYSTYKPPSKQLGHSLRKSFRCVPEKETGRDIIHESEQPEVLFNLSHIIPPVVERTPSVARSAPPYTPHSRSPRDMYSSFESMMEPSFGFDVDSDSEGYPALSMDEEHALIARYTRCLTDSPYAAATSTLERIEQPSQISMQTEDSYDEEQLRLMLELEERNRDMMRKIVKLKRQRELEMESPANASSISAELSSLRMRKGNLEEQLSTLQNSRRELTDHLEGLMEMLRDQCTMGSTSSPASPLTISHSSSAPSTPGAWYR